MYAGPVTLSDLEKRRLLAGVSLFEELDSKVLGSLTDVSRTATLATRKELFHKGDEASTIYVLATGKLKIVSASELGEEIVFNVIKSGEVIGEISLFAATTRTATVVALEPSVLVAIDRRDFLSFLQRQPDVAVQLLAVLASRVRVLSELVEDNLFLNLPVRLAKKIVSFANDYGVDTAEGRRINLKLSQREWGHLVGASRESINKQMRSWTREGLLSVEGGCVIVQRMEDLQKIVGHPRI